MSCKPGEDCSPCQDCPPAPTPVLPRCDIALVDGVYANATITVEDGCIVLVEAGEAFLYQPDACCASGSGGEGGDGLDGDPGPPGAAGTITINSVATTAPGTLATVTNVGTPNNAILNITIPRGDPGVDGADPSGITDNTAGIEIVDGSVQSLPVTWPPVLNVVVAPIAVAGVALSMIKDPMTGQLNVVLDMDAFYSQMQTYVNDQIAAALAPIQSQITDIQTNCC